MSELRKLTWRYFWQQKWKEIKNPLIVTSAIGAYFFLMMGFLGDYNFAKIIGLCLIIPLIIKLLIVIIKWIKSNWRIAFERAKGDLNYKTTEELANLNEEFLL